MASTENYEAGYEKSLSSQIEQLQLVKHTRDAWYLVRQCSTLLCTRNGIHMILSSSA